MVEEEVLFGGWSHEPVAVGVGQHRHGLVPAGLVNPHTAFADDELPAAIHFYVPIFDEALLIHGGRLPFATTKGHLQRNDAVCVSKIRRRMHAWICKSREAPSCK